MKTAVKTNINKEQNFEKFVVGTFNRFAVAAAMHIVNNPGTAYNPLLIYGDSGTGKTHLLHAIGNAVLETVPKTKVRYVTAEAFTNEFINAIQSHRVKDFQVGYLSLECLLVDDIQFLVGKERTQEELFYILNALKGIKTQIVLACSCHPKRMEKLEERLRCSFVNGLTVDIHFPDLKNRMDILRKRAETANVDIPDSVIKMVAVRMDGHIQVMEGAYNRIMAYSKLMHAPIDITVAEKLLGEFGV